MAAAGCGGLRRRAIEVERGRWEVEQFGFLSLRSRRVWRRYTAVEELAAAWPVGKISGAPNNERLSGECGVTPSGKLVAWEFDCDIISAIKTHSPSTLKACIRDVTRILCGIAAQHGLQLSYPEYQFTWNGYRWT
jgi:hypothetical protein